MASVKCLNVAVYKHWCDQRAMPLLGKQVDFAPHAKSLSGSSLPAIATHNQLDNKPTRPIIEEAITTLKNESPRSSNFPDLAQIIRTAKGRIKEYIDALGSTINNHTSTKVDEAQEAQ
jgi:hypothetical protein